MKKVPRALKDVSDDEVLKLAMNIEEQGYNFYMSCLKGVRHYKAGKDEPIRFFSRLANFEKKHLAAFSRLHRRVAKRSGVFATDEDALVKNYINALIDPGIFEKHACPVIGSNRDSVLRALEFAKSVEKDTVLFYMELEEIARSQETKKLLQTIIKEEKRHVIDIDRLMKEFQ